MKLIILKSNNVVIGAAEADTDVVVHETYFTIGDATYAFRQNEVEIIEHDGENVFGKVRMAGGEFVDFVAPVNVEQLAAAKEVAKKRATDRRYEVEVGGINLGGLTVKTDRESQSQVNSAFNSLKNNLVPFIDFKGMNGWVQLSLAEVEPLAAAVAQHVQACFTNEKALHAAIDAAETIGTVLAVNIGSGWQGA